MKKTYISPEQEVIILNTMQPLLTISGDDLSGGDSGGSGDIARSRLFDDEEDE